jgi:F-type H+-transporting ATPase subunit gamma
MANLKELRGRIGSVKNTRKITAAMSQIAAARLRKAQNAVAAATPYGKRMQEVVSHLVAGIRPQERAEAHPLLAERKVDTVSVFVMTADRGLCGGFNANVNRAALRLGEQREREGQTVRFTTIGKKSAAFLKHARQDIGDRALPAPALDTLVELSKQAASAAIEAFLAPKGDPKRVDQVLLVYNRFVSVLSQEVVVEQLLPLLPPPVAPGTRDTLEPEFEPSREAILEHLVPVAIESMLQQAMFNSIAAEIAARRVAMDSATDNATELIADLTLEYNRERQAAITKELMEIVGGAEALKG